MSQTTTILRLESLSVLIGVFLAFNHLDYNWWLFALLLVPDVFMVGYIKNNKIGAFAYNIGHSYLFPVALGIIGYVLSMDTFYALALIWVAHIGMDRALGYGLKSEKGFQHTHLGKIGKN